MRIHRFVIPVLVAVSLVGGYSLRTAFTQPTSTVTYDQQGGQQSTFIVDGLKCKGPAGFFTSLYDSLPGVLGIETFATEHKAIFTYDPDIISRDSIQAIMEQEMIFNDGSRGQVFKMVSVE